MNYGPPPRDQLLPSCLPNLSWDQSMDLLGTIIPSQPVAISSEISSFMGDPLNSMHVNRLMLFPSDVSFTEKAESYSCFSAGNYGTLAGHFGPPEAGKLSRVSSSKSLKAKERPIPSHEHSELGDGMFGSGREDSSVTNPGSASGDCYVKKRKAEPKNKGKVAEENDLNAKKCRSAVSTGKNMASFKPKEDQNCVMKNEKDNGSGTLEPPKDYIHVRARRGQATDSHSIAERVRREKIGERMKLLEDLVPGCNKITGKALMLDEIINYVQSLQRQVEFLSMKLATVNPRLDFNLDNLITKEFLRNQAKASMSNSLYPIDNLAAGFPFSDQSKEGTPLHLNVANILDINYPMSQYESILHQTATLQPSLDMFGGAAASQVGNLFDDVFQSVLRTSFGHNQQKQQEIGGRHT